MGAPGNDQVIAALEHMLNRARAGQIGYVIAVMVDQHEQAMGGWSGTYALQGSCMKALEQMAGSLDAEVTNKTLPPRDPSVPANRVVYNMPCSPMSYDFLNWLADAEMNRRIKGAPAPLRVCFWFGRDGNAGFQAAAHQQMFEHVMKPALDLVGAVEDPTADDGHVKTIFTLRDVVDAHRRGFEVPKFRPRLGASTWAAKKFSRRPPITITLREMALQPYRNSNIDAWMKFAFHLKHQGERVIFVRDTARSHERMDEFETCPEASVDLHGRMALYSAAKLNLFVANGPSTLGWFGDFPWMAFTRIEPDGHEYTPNTPSFWRDNIGVEVGSQLPWARPDQRIIWKPDDYENLIKAWEEFQPTAKIAAAE